MNHSLKTRVLSLILALVMVVGFVPVHSLAEAEQIYTYQTSESTLAPGIIQTVNSGYAADGRQINYYVATADINREDVGIHTSYKDAQCEVAGMAKMTEQAASLQALHSNPEDAKNYIPYYAIVAGVNGDGYNTGTGKPSGVHIANGVVGFGVAKTANSSWFAIFEDGIALCGANDKDWDEAIAAHGKAVEAIGGFQLVRKNGVNCSYSDSSYLNDGRYPRSFVGVTADNKVVFMVADGNGSGGSAGTNWKESVEIMDEAGCTYILCLDGGGSATYISRPEGSNEIQVTSDPSDGSERAVSNGLVMYTTTPPSDVFSYANISAEAYYLAPGAQTAITAVGVSLAGTAAAIPENAVWEVTGGTVENGVFTAGQNVGDAVINLVVDGVTVGSATVHVVLPERLSFARETMTIPMGGTVELEITATYGVYEVVTAEDTIVLTIDQTAVGSLSGFTFTAAEETEVTEAIITAAVNHAASNVAATAKIMLGQGSEVLFDFESDCKGADLSNWGTSYMYTNNVNLPDVSIVTKETGMVRSGEQAMAYHYAMDEALHGTEFWNGGLLIWTGDSVEIKNATKLGFWIYVPEDAVQLSFWMGVCVHDENGNFIGQNASSMEIFNEDYVNNRDHSGWMYVEMPITADTVYLEDNADLVGKYFNGTQFKHKANAFLTVYQVNIDSWKYNETNYAGDFTFYIDDVTVDYSEAVDDRQKPVFSDMTYAVTGMSDAASLKGQTVTEKTVSFASLVTEDMTNPNNASGLDAATAVAYIDGTQVDCSYANGMITVPDVTLADGTHTIRMGISDKMGNYAEIKRQITVSSGSNDASVRVRPQDSSLNYILNAAVYWIDVEADNVENIKTVEAKLDLDSMNNWVLDQIQVLYGFDCTAYFATGAEKAENILTLKFTRNDDYLSASGTAVLASLPVRVWDYVCSDDHKHANAVEAWNCAYVCAPALSIDVDTELGVVSYSDGTSHSFSSADIHTLGVSYTYGVKLRDSDKEYYNSHSFHVHSAKAIADKAATCTENGYTGRTWCDTCASAVDWGTTVPATGHSFAATDGVLKCACGVTFTGIYTDGQEYVDGIVLAGWQGDSYYQNGVKLTGIQIIDGYYYDFGENGVCAGQNKLTGLFFDETVSAYRYAKLGELQSGWVQIDNKWHYFDTTTKVAVTGDYYYAARGVTYHFDETGMTEGVWQKTKEGTRFWYGQWYYQARGINQAYFVEIDGKTYNFDKDGYMTVGIHALYYDWTHNMRGEMDVWEFDENGVLVGQITDKGLIDNKLGGMYLVEEDGFVHGGNEHVASYNGDLYFVCHSGKLKQDGVQKITAGSGKGLLAEGSYYFGKDGKLFTGIKEEADGLYYYKNGQIGKGIYNSELAEIDGSIYLVKWSGKVAVNETRELTDAKSNGLLKAGTYYFAEDGKLFTASGLVWNEAEQMLYYYADGQIGKGIYNSELVKIDGNIYLIKWSGKVAFNETREITDAKSNGLLKAGTYYFGADGKLFSGVKEEADALYCYENGKMVNRTYNSELAEINGEIYLVKWSGKVAANETRTIPADKTNGLLKAGTYYFGADGKLFTGVMEDADGVLVYYENGQLGKSLYYSELVSVNGDIYLVKWSGKVAVNETRAIAADKTNGLVKAGTYTFGADGKLQA